ncbi:hypothetical protein TWF506_010524 [Arthrobotrys conoides]|uniref:Uncharacterized protein n=1 Tax=Arthrobotrys conoides TaxID=74498 RepID=A0AAN8NHK5_9PEZI
MSLRPSRDSNPPFPSIRQLFDHLHTNPSSASALNNAYPKRGIFKSTAINNTLSDQKFTIDLSQTHDTLIPASIRSSLAPHGLEDVLSFFNESSRNPCTNNTILT